MQVFTDLLSKLLKIGGVAEVKAKTWNDGVEAYHNIRQQNVVLHVLCHTSIKASLDVVILLLFPLQL